MNVKYFHLSSWCSHKSAVLGVKNSNFGKPLEKADTEHQRLPSGVASGSRFFLTHQVALDENLL